MIAYSLFSSAASVLLAAAGLFSVMSYTVGRRLREFAVRQALGASPREVLRLVLRGAFELALGGTAFGALLSFWASAGVSAVLFGVKNTDPISLIIAELTLLVVTMLASLVPAVRAMRADPVEGSCVQPDHCNCCDGAHVTHASPAAPGHLRRGGRRIGDSGASSARAPALRAARTDPILVLRSE